MDPARLTIALQFGPISVVCKSANRVERDKARATREKVVAVMDGTPEEGAVKELFDEMESLIVGQVETVERDGEVLHEGDDARTWVMDQELFIHWEDLWRAFLEVFFHRWLAVQDTSPRGPVSD